MRIFIPVLLILFNISASAQDNSSIIEAGRQIYETGLLPDGKPLLGKRNENFSVSGGQAACVLCHRRSGMGLAEGASLIPPITATALFGKFEFTSIGRKPQYAAGMKFTDWPHNTRPPYDDTTLATAIRTGISSNGYHLKYIMPRYDLSSQDMNALIAYLHTLSIKPSQGITSKGVYFATVVTPEIPPEKSKAFLQVLQTCITEKSPSSESSPTWQLQVWNLNGAPSSWQSQMNENYARQPVFAIISGIGTDNWKPIENFCEQTAVPCLFPNTELPGSNDEKHFSFYFSRGSMLEADVISKYLAEQSESQGLRKVVTLSRPDGTGFDMANAIKNHLIGKHIPVETSTIEDYTGDTSKKLMHRMDKSTALVLLLKSEDLSALTKHQNLPPRAGWLVLSGLLGGLEETPLPSSWREHALMTYPFDAPARWNYRMSFNLRPWLAEKGIERNDERMQGNTLAACNLLYEGMLRLRGQYQREYLIENIENYPTQMGNAPAAQAYPRFSIGPGQRFSSKGAHIVRFAGPDLKQLKPEQEWIIP